MAQTLSHLALDVRKHDRDRFVTALFAPAAKREALFALYAFNAELARVRELVSEPLLGEMRLQWWRDAIEKFYSGGYLAHPVAEGLAAAIRAHQLSRGLFDRLIDARAADLLNGPPADLAALEAYADGTSATVVALAAEILGARGAATAPAIRHAGIGWALVGLLRAYPFHAAAGRIYLPADLLARHGVDAGELRAGKRPSGLTGVIEAMAAAARHHLTRARRARRDVPRAARPALLVCAMGRVYLNRLRMRGYDTGDRGWSAVRPPVLRLAARSLLGRY